ncbi:MAG: type II secretion system protein [Candidatus Absconditabacterales bacterium]
MKRAFTLIEMMIVIAVIAILLTVTLKFGNSRILDLKNQSSKEEFTSFYNQLYSQNLISNYQNAQKYNFMEIYLSTGIGYSYDGNKDIIYNQISKDINIIGLNISGKQSDKVKLKLLPFKLGCDIINTNTNLTGDSLQFNILVGKTQKKYCFEIGSQNCKLIQVNCE